MEKPRTLLGAVLPLIMADNLAMASVSAVADRSGKVIRRVPVGTSGRRTGWRYDEAAAAGVTYPPSETMQLFGPYTVIETLGPDRSPLGGY